MVTRQSLALVLLTLLATLASAAEDARCPSVASATGATFTVYTLYSHRGYDGSSKHSHNISCSWKIAAPSQGSTWLMKFHVIDLESSVTVRQCKYDNLTVIYQLKGRTLTSVLCGKHYNLYLLTNGSIELAFRTDSSINNNGFRITWISISGREAATRMSQMSPVFLSEDSSGSCNSLHSILRRPTTFGGHPYNVSKVGMSVAAHTYIHNADCTWTIQAQENEAVYMTFESVLLEGRPPCTIDNVTVTYQLNRQTPSQRRSFCYIRSRLTLVSRGMVTLRLRTDGSVGNNLSITWFVAPYTGLSGMFPTSSEFREEQCPQITPRSNGGTINLYYEPPLTYESRMRCTWIVSVPTGKVVDFNFTKFQLARGHYLSWRRYNYTHLGDYCPNTEDSVRIMYRSYDIRDSKSFCYGSNVQLGEVALTAAGQVIILFTSNGYRNSHGFVLQYKFREQTHPIAETRACPPVRQLDNYRQKIANSSEQPSIISGARICFWSLKSPGEGHLLSLMISLNSIYPSPYFSSYAIRYPERFSSLCNPMVTVTSENYVSSEALILAEDIGQGRVDPRPFRREYCPTVIDTQVGLFAGDVNVSIVSQRSNIDMKGFVLLVTKIPKPRRGCSTVNVSTEHYRSRIVKVFNITAKAGCIASESAKSFSSIYSKTMLKVTFQLTCSESSSNEALDVISELYVTTVKCGTTKTVYDPWKHPLILKFPLGTDANVISRVSYDFPVQEAFCQKLNSKTTARNNGTIGSYILPLIVSSLSIPIGMRSLGSISCNYELEYRPGYSILLKIHHNLGYDDIDFYCHAKTTDERINPHIVLTVNERDRENPSTWMERQLEMCHGYSVGSLGTKSEILIEGSVSVNLLALSTRVTGGNRTASDMALGLMHLLNTTLPQPLQFTINYEYVPSCPELICRTQSGSKSSCLTNQMSNLIMEATIVAGNVAPNCKLSITNAEVRSTLARQSNTLLAKVEISNFAIACPCHDCEADESQEFVTLSQQTTDATSAAENIVVCGNYLNTSNTCNIYMPVGQGQSDIQMAFSAIESGATVRVTFVDCQKNNDLKQCKMALLQNQIMAQSQAGSAISGGLIFATILLAAILIGCLLYINRQTLVSGGSRLQESLRSRRPPADDMLQLDSESEPAQ